MPAATAHTTTAATAAVGVPVRGRRAQRVCVPWRIVADEAYSDRALAVYAKVAALAARREGCTAGVETIAGFLGWAKSAVEKALTELINPWGTDQLVEVPTRRRTKRGGDGDTAERYVRQLGDDELFVWLPVAAAEVLRPRQLRLYAAIAHATARRMPISYEEVAGLLGVTPRTVGTLVKALDASGWITVHWRAGDHGRHLYEVHTHPLRAVPTTPEPPCGPEQLELPFADETAGETQGGSGDDLAGGSLASKEDHLLLTDSDHAPAAPRGTRRRRQLPVREAVEISALPGRALGTFTGNQQQNNPEADRRRPLEYTGPPLSLSPRIWHALEPVRDLLPEIRPYMLRRAARQLGAELGPGTDPAHVERIRRRIEGRRAVLDGGRPRDPAAWLLHVAIVPRGCGLTACEDGWLYRPWAPGPPVECAVCAEERSRRRLARTQHQRIAAGLCPHHGTPPTRTGACPGCVVDRAAGIPLPELLPPPDGLPAGTTAA